MKMNQKKDKLSVRLVNKILLADLIVVFLSGILLQIFQEVLGIRIFHKLSSTVLVLGVIVHVIQHKKKKGMKNNE